MSQMIGNYQCWTLIGMGINFTCCNSCHKSGEKHKISMQDGSEIYVCCGALASYYDSDKCQLEVTWPE